MMSEENGKAKQTITDLSEAHRLAAECIELIDSTGGVFCSADGVLLVIRVLCEYYD